MKMGETLAALVVVGALLCGTGARAEEAAAPTIAAAAARHGAVVVSLATATKGAEIYYTVDGSTPGTASMEYFAPFLVDSDVTVKAMAKTTDGAASAVTSRRFAAHIRPGTLVWSEEFGGAAAGKGEPNPRVWAYDTGNGGFGNGELETYCAWGSNEAPCDSAQPNAYTDASGLLHLAARRPKQGIYTSARLKTQGLFSFQYGRLEARMKLPESQGMWPAFWLLGSNIAKVDWPASGEIDVMEHIDGANPEKEGFDWVQGTLHGTGLSHGIQYHAKGFSAAEWHTYGMIWTKGKIEFYVDEPANVYATFTPKTQAGRWPFDDGPEFILLNLAVGGAWPGPPDETTVFPSHTLVDFVRIYAN